ncbi:mucin-5AC [Hyalella azteca]|uniref:Mucin-5AC n=1 Tax=Hyalella azteca TaxID=294128 RepID=A0A8B7PA44_HYAAZ|nr:mucin-5AC [Hyalella azteca]
MESFPQNIAPPSKFSIPTSELNQTINKDYLEDEYYEDYYYDEENLQGNDSEKRGNQPEDLGPIDPPLVRENQPTTRKFIRPSDATTPATAKRRSTTPSSRSSNTRYSLSELLASLGGKNDKKPPPTSNELSNSRDARVLSEIELETTTPTIKYETITPEETTVATTQSTTITSTTPRTVVSTTSEPRMEVRITNTTESTFVVANVQTSRSMSMRHEESDDYSSALNLDEETTPTEILFEKPSIEPKPSLTALFENIDITYNDSDKEAVEDITTRNEPDTEASIIDITTEAEKLSNTENFDLSSLLEKVFEKAKPADLSKLPAGFSTSQSSSTHNSSVSSSKQSATSSKPSIQATTPKTVENLVDMIEEAEGNTSAVEGRSNSSPKLTKEELLLAAIFGNSEPSDPPASLLPAGFSLQDKKKQREDKPEFNIPVAKAEVPAHLLPKGFNVPEKSKGKTPLVREKSDVPASLLPKGFNVPVGADNITSQTPKTTEALIATTAVTAPGAPYQTSKNPKGLIFPKRNDRPSFLSTTPSSVSDSEPSAPLLLKPTIVNVFDRIKTTPKLVVMAPTKAPKTHAELQAEVASESSSSTTTTTTTTSTTTATPTTTLPPRPTTPGVCGEKCRLAATLRIVDGAEWAPELANRDTKEWQTLAKSVTNELNALYQRSRINRWFVDVEVDAFNPGSVFVDYFLQLNDVTTALDTVDLKHMMNGLLQSSNRAEHKLGPLTVDPEGTDFVVVKEPLRSVVRDDGSYLIPEWLIAVIVISLASFLFIIIFGIAVLVSRARVRRRNVPLTEEVLNKLNANQMPVDNYHNDAVYDMEAIWNEKMADRNMKPPSNRGHGYNPNYNINIYDSWRTDWSGPYGSSATYAKRRPEANF